MRESRTIHLNAEDLAALRQGQPLLIEGADGHPLLRIEWDGTKRRVPSTPETIFSAKVTKLEKCPYCDKMLRSVKAHIYQRHPGKSLDPSGTKCRYCAKRFGSDVSVMRHEVRSHPKVFRSRVSGKPSAKLQAKASVNAKEAPHA
jgi:uncharacterized C2H2 Zn-finger protein